MDVKELRELAGYVTKLAESDIPDALEAASIIHEVTKKTAGVSPVVTGLGGLALGAGAMYAGMKAHENKKIKNMARALPEITTPRERLIMEENMKRAFIAGYNRAIGDIRTQLMSRNKRKKAEAGEIRQSEQMRKILEKIAESLTTAADRIEELEMEKKRLETEIKFNKLAEAMVESGLASNKDQATAMINEYMSENNDVDGLIKILKNKTGIDFFK